MATPGETKSGMKIVNFGCGPNPSPGALNIDGSPTVLLARLPLPAAVFGPRRDFVAAVREHNVRFKLDKSLSFPRGSLDGFYSSHTLEHLPRERCVSLLSKVRRWLKPSGVLRLALPDLRHFAASYASGEIDSDRFVQSLGLAVDGARWWSIALGHSYHRWMYDAQAFSSLLLRLGYQQLRECGFREGKIPAVASLDLKERRSESFYIEAE